MKRIVNFAAVCTLALVLTACGGSGSDGGGSSAAVATSEANATELKLIASNWEFDQAEYTVSVGEPIVFSLENEAGYHEYKIEGLGINIKPGDPKQYTINEAGTYDIVCSFQCGAGHNTMKSKLIVQ